MKRTKRRLAGRPTASVTEEVTKAILDAAAKVFNERGFVGATLQQIAKEALVSRQTLYARFPNKEAVFIGLLEDRTDRLLNSITLTFEDDTEPRVALRHFAKALVSQYIDTGLQDLHRSVIASSSAFPTIAENFFRLGPDRGRTLLIAYLTKQNRQGKLQIPQISYAAEQLVGSLIGLVIVRANLRQIEPIASPEKLEIWVSTAVDTFMARYASDGIAAGSPQ